MAWLISSDCLNKSHTQMYLLSLEMLNRFVKGATQNGNISVYLLKRGSLFILNTSSVAVKIKSDIIVTVTVMSVLISQTQSRLASRINAEFKS